jgi:2-dehydro-3-deoxyphosphogluconate aldolase / (4S)-4-hydroxy-2-oxoglutarate aldolase
MAPTRAAVLSAFAQHRCSAILRTNDREVVRPALEAVIAGGMRIVEVTMTTPDCLEHIAALSERHGIVVGAGTVLSVDDAKEAMAAGARFLVSPVTASSRPAASPRTPSTRGSRPARSASASSPRCSTPTT